jgi:hypothetical protein
MNREFLKEAIADAKAVKESAIANAKAALEESFTPHLKSMLAAKINEMEKDEEEMYEAKSRMEKEDMNENYEEVEAKDAMADVMDEEMNLDEILAELEKMDEEEQLNEVEEEEKYEDSDADGIPDEKDETPEGEAKGEAEEEEEIDLEDMSEEDLKSFIESVIADMVKAGELEAGHEDEEEEEEGEEELVMTMEAEDELDEEKDAMYEAMKVKMKEMEEELNETRKALKTVKTDLTEVNLLNAKLLYTNKIFRNKNLTESQKVKVLGAFDKAASVKEAKLVFETISESLNTPKKSINENIIGRASKSAGTSTTTKQPIVESNEMITRFQKLAGIIKN